LVGGGLYGALYGALPSLIVAVAALQSVALLLLLVTLQKVRRPSAGHRHAEARI
jgi:hypothetical protein